MSTLVRVAALANYVEVAERAGLNAETQLQRFGMSRAHLMRREPLELDAVIALLEQSAADSGCDSFGLQMAEARKAADLGVLSLLLVHVGSLREALRTLVQFQRMVNPALSMQIEETAGQFIIDVGVITAYPGVPRQAIELTMGVICRLCAELSEDHWHPHAIYLTHLAGADLHWYQRVLGCTPQFGAEFNGICWRSAALDQPMPGGDAALARHAARVVAAMPAGEQNTLVLDVQKAIYQALPHGRASIQLVARELGTTVRTLQHRLRKQDAVFTELVNDAQCNLAMHYMGNPGRNLGEISEMLGFKMPASFTRWFEAQFGMPPSQWRKAQPARLLA